MTRASIFFAALFLTDCAAVPKDSGFSSVASEVRLRIDQDVVWRDPDEALEDDELLRRPLDADRAVQVALRYNAELQAAFEDLRGARAAALSAAAVENPRAAGEMKFGGEGTSPVIELEISQSLTELLSAPRRRGMASVDVEAAGLEAAEVALDLALAVRTAFYRHQADLERRELWRTSDAAAEAIEATVRALYEAGNVPVLELYRAQAERERARASWSAAELAVAESRTELDVLMGLWGKDAAWTVEAKLAEPPPALESPDEIERQAISHSLGLAALRHRIAAAGARAGLARFNGLVPDIELGVAASREDDNHWFVGPRIEVELPLFNQGGGATAGADAELKRLQHRYRAEAVRVRAASRAAAARTSATHQRALQHRAVLMPLGDKILQETQRRVNAMVSGVFELLDAKRAQLAGAREYVDAVEAYWTARAELDQLLRGGRLELGGSRGPSRPSEAAPSSRGGH